MSCGNCKSRNNIYLNGRFHKKCERRYSDKGQYDWRNTPNVRHHIYSICSSQNTMRSTIMLQLIPLSSRTKWHLFELTEQTNANTHTVQPQQLVIEQRDINNQNCLYVWNRSVTALHMAHEGDIGTSVSSHTHEDLHHIHTFWRHSSKCLEKSNPKKKIQV